MPAATMPAIEDTTRHIEWCIGIGQAVEPETEAARLQQGVFRIVAAGNLWRALVEQISDNIMEENLRRLAEPMGQLARLTLKACNAILSASSNRTGLKSLDEIELAAHEERGGVSRKSSERGGVSPMALTLE